MAFIFLYLSGVINTNPYSVLLTLSKQEFGSYWFETGTPSYLVYLLQKHDYNLEEMSHVEADEDVLNSIDSESSKSHSSDISERFSDHKRF